VFDTHWSTAWSVYFVLERGIMLLHCAVRQISSLGELSPVARQLIYHD